MPERSAPIPGDPGPQPQGLPDRHIGPSNPFAVFPPDAIEPAPARVEAIAADSLGAMRARQPDGPYLIVGECVGGDHGL